MKSIILMVILNGKKVNKMNAANSGYTPLKRRIAAERYVQFGLVEEGMKKYQNKKMIKIGR